MHWLAGARLVSAEVVQPNPVAGIPVGSSGQSATEGGAVLEHVAVPLIAALQNRSVEYCALTQNPPVQSASDRHGEQSL